MDKRVDRLFSQVGRRDYAARAARAWSVWTIGFSGLFAVCLLSNRLLALMPPLFRPWTLLLPPLAGGLAALAFCRPRSRAQLAHLIDARAATDDLFLTVACLDAAPGEFRSLVARQATERAAELQPAAVVPWEAWQRLSRVLAVLTVLAAAVLYLPQFDPFGRDAERREQESRAHDTEVQRLATRDRLAILQATDNPARTRVAESLNDLQHTFRTMQAKAAKTNLQRLSQQQQELGRVWRSLSDQRLRTSFTRPPPGQQFGRMAMSQRTEAWRQGVQSGSLAGPRQELRELQQAAREMAAAKTPGEQRQQAEALRQRLEDLAEFLRQQLGSAPAQAAVERALEQLSAASQLEAAPEALGDLLESLELGQLELAAVEGELADLKALERALEALQLAKQLNQLQQLDGEACAGCESIGDYAQLYRELLAAGMVGAAGQGQGMRGPGHGKGGQAEEDDTADTDFVPEKVKSALQAGKALLSWKVRDATPSGVARENYGRQLAALREGLGEAILKEQIPPPYHESVKRYFDTLKPPAQPTPGAED